ncbi:MAG: NnrU family protein [Candidatus Hodarchaeota archaeon]
MDIDLFFRISFLVLWIMLGLVRGYYARKTKTHDNHIGIKEKLKTELEQEGKWLMVVTAIFTVIGVIGLILFLLAPSRWTWTRLPLGTWVRWLGITITIISIFFLIWVHRHLDRQWSLALEIQTDHKLITTGPYKWIRHPMYLGIFVYTIGLILISSDLLILLFFGFTIWVNYRRIPKEEQMMINEFGDEYREYMKYTGRFLPRSYKKGD